MLELRELLVERGVGAGVVRVSTTPSIWHDLECGAYESDLPLWRELAAEARGPILDVGAGTGRVALDLARRGHEVVALDLDAELLEALRERADGVPVETVCADARELRRSARRFPLILVPMQTLQLLGGATGGRRSCARARAHLEPGGLLAIAIADALEGFDDASTRPPLPDMRELAGVVYVAAGRSRSLDEGDRVAIERLREIVDRDGGARARADDVVRLDARRRARRARGARPRGWACASLPRRHVPATDEYVGSTVVMLGA